MWSPWLLAWDHKDRIISQAGYPDSGFRRCTIGIELRTTGGLYQLRGPLVVFYHFFSQNFYIIRLLKTTDPIKFLDSSNWEKIFDEKLMRKMVRTKPLFPIFKQKLIIQKFCNLWKNTKKWSNSDLFIIILLFTRYLCSVWAIEKLNRMSRFRKQNFIKLLAEKVVKTTRGPRYRYIAEKPTQFHDS